MKNKITTIIDIFLAIILGGVILLVLQSQPAIILLIPIAILTIILNIIAMPVFWAILLAGFILSGLFQKSK